MNPTKNQVDHWNVKRYLPWVVAIALFMEQLDSTIVNTAVPSIAASLHVAPLSLKTVVSSYILSLAVCIPNRRFKHGQYHCQLNATNVHELRIGLRLIGYCMVSR